MRIGSVLEGGSLALPSLRLEAQVLILLMFIERQLVLEMRAVAPLDGIRGDCLPLVMLILESDSESAVRLPYLQVVALGPRLLEAASVEGACRVPSAP